jgi:hypothetical protein
VDERALARARRAVEAVAAPVGYAALVVPGPAR